MIKSKCDAAVLLLLLIRFMLFFRRAFIAFLSCSQSVFSLHKRVFRHILNLTLIAEQDRSSIFDSTLSGYFLDCLLHCELSFLCRFRRKNTVSEWQLVLWFQVIYDFLKLGILLQFHLYILQSLFTCLHQNYQNINLWLFVGHFFSWITL